MRAMARFAALAAFCLGLTTFACAAESDFTGTWDTRTDKGRGYEITFFQDGSHVTGTYVVQNGDKGRIDGIVKRQAAPVQMGAGRRLYGHRRVRPFTYRYCLQGCLSRRQPCEPTGRESSPRRLVWSPETEIAGLPLACSSRGRRPRSNRRWVTSRRYRARRERYSTLMSACLATRPYLSYSARTNASNSAGGIPPDSADRSAKRF